eukprot:6112743-Amphidinium_carterae.1
MAQKWVKNGFWAQFTPENPFLPTFGQVLGGLEFVLCAGAETSLQTLGDHPVILPMLALLTAKIERHMAGSSSTAPCPMGKP